MDDLSYEWCRRSHHEQRRSAAVHATRQFVGHACRTRRLGGSGRAGALFGTSFSNLLQNNANQLIFSTTLLDDPNNANDNVTTSNDLALFGWDPVGGYSLIAREGDNLSSIGINMTLTGSWLSMFNTASTEGGAYALTDNGWLTFRVAGTALPTFSDTAAIVRTQLPAAVPEPGTLTMLAAAGALALCRRRAV